MEQWEFLLQREGTEDWQILDGSRVEVNTGKYRLICRSPWPDREVLIVLTYTPISGKEKIKKRLWQPQLRSPRNNAQGLMVVMPFTLLQPGNWQWQIFHPDAEELLTEITLGVMAIASALPSNIASRTTAEISNPQVSQPPEIPSNPAQQIPTETPYKNQNRPLISIDALREQSLAEIDSVLQEAIDGVWSQLEAEPILESTPVFLDYAEYSQELPDYAESYYPIEDGIEPSLPITPPLGTFTLPVNSLPSSPALSFCLDQDHFTAQQGEYLVITGRVELSLGALLSEAELPAELRDTLLQGSIQYQLRDPSSASILLTVEYPLAVKVPVGDFSHTLKIPPKTNSQLILGEATLYGKEEQVLASQSFMISSGLANLLEVVETTLEELPQPPLTAPSKRQNHPVLPYQPFSSLALDPHRGVPKPIGRKKSPGGKTKPLELPNFSGSNRGIQEESDSGNRSFDSGNRSFDRSITSQDLNLDAQEKEISPLDRVETIPETIESVPLPNPEVTALNSPISLTGDLPLEAEAGLQASNFLARLNSLASDRQMTDILHTELLLDNAAPGALQRQPLPPRDESNWSEVVVDDEPPEAVPEPRFDSSGFPYPPESRPDTLVPTAPQPVPVPEIIAPLGELLTGDTVTVTVKLPAEQFSLYVKFWVKDCQTTAIIDGPRMLLDFSPNSQGELETLARLTVPPGCCRLRLEAIAIDPHQETESRKASIDRVVVPPGLSPTPDFNYLAS